MKFLCVLLIPAVLAAVPSKRVIFNTFLNSQEATRIIDTLVETLATNDNEAKCEQECHILITNQDSVFQHLCPFMCHSAQEALNHLHSPSTDPTATGKRMLFSNLLNTEESSKIIDQLVVTLSSDSSEAACETECHVLIRDSTSVFQHMCPFLCHSAQALIGNLHHTAPATGAKRLVLGNLLNTEESSKIIDQLVVTLSSDSSEAACETECHVLIRDSTSVFQHMCPFLCHSAQALIGNLHHTAPATGAKRLVLGNLLNTEESSKIIDQLVVTLSSDSSEAACETECHVLIRDSTSVFQHMCPFLCHSAQALIGNLHHTAPATGAKRLVLGNLLNTEESSKIIDQLVVTLSSDSSEAACETECHVLIRDSTSVFQHMCPFLCHSAQALIGNLHHTAPATGAKRLVLGNLLNTEESSKIIDQLVVTLSSDSSEAACETECHVLIRDSTSVFQHMCPFLCHSAQALIGNLHHTAPATGAKRLVLDTFMNNPEINVLVTGLVATLGSDPTEQACESQCITMVHADNVLHHLCPFVCHSFQSLVQKVHLTPSVSNPVHKRFMIDNSSL
ncbi:uncharacterized protein LOC111114602 [Crassostrea virginica]|uniref:Uncharacterized protein LOC111114602 n=1 Tax=Crassostrea virginica TaxID=6565 RepID=A0A8B8BZF4_CRAVI|nr:uncharacterized protein LOC111114602 [Crassostrea virginica]